MPSNIAISALPAAGAVTSGNVLPIVQAGVTVKAQVSGLVAGLPIATGSSAGTMSASDKTKLDAATNANTASTIVQRDPSGNFTAGTITATRVTGLATPTASTDAANKGYVDAAAQGLNIHAPVRVATTGSNIDLNAAPTTLDGVSLAANDRILVKNQTTGSQNGIYFVNSLGSGSNGVWQRASDADTSAELATGTYVYVTAGTLNANTSWVMNTPPPINLGTTALTWVLYSSLTSIPAANITGQIVAAQIADAAINTAKFAAGITPVEIVATLPSSGNFEGRQAFLTTDNKLYRYTGTAWTAAVATVDLTGQIVDTQITDAAITATKIATSAVTTTKIADDAITSPKIVAGSVTTGKLDALAVTADKISTNAITSDKISANAIIAGKIAANAVTVGTVAANAITAGTIAANAVTAGTIAAGAVSATEIAAGAITTGKIYAGAVDTNALAANAVTAGKILAGTITGDRIAANTITSGKMLITNLSDISTSVLGGTGSTGAITLNSTYGQIQTAVGTCTAYMSAWNPGTGVTSYVGAAYGGTRVEMQSSFTGASLVVGSSVSLSSSNDAVNLSANCNITFGNNARLKKVSSDGWAPILFDGDNTIELRWDGSTVQARIDGSTIVNLS